MVNMNTKCLEWLEGNQVISLEYGSIRHNWAISPDLGKGEVSRALSTQVILDMPGSGLWHWGQPPGSSQELHKQPLVLVRQGGCRGAAWGGCWKWAGSWALPESTPEQCKWNTNLPGLLKPFSTTDDCLPVPENVPAHGLIHCHHPSQECP